MATIVPSKEAPSEDVVYGFAATDSFTLGPNGSFETDDRQAIAEAQVHPWLTVEVEKGTSGKGNYRDDSVAPKDDALSAQNSIAFDPEEVEKANKAAEGQETAPVAIDAGLKQTTKKKEGGIAETLAADPTREGDSK
jgi:hypothetical protein